MSQSFTALSDPFCAGLDATTFITEMLNPSKPPLSFDAVLDRSREAYLASPIGKARKALAKAEILADQLQNRLEEIGIALTRGDGSEAAIGRMQAVLLDLRIVCADAEALARLVEASA